MTRKQGREMFELSEEIGQLRQDLTGFQNLLGLWVELGHVGNTRAVLLALSIIISLFVGVNSQSAKAQNVLDGVYAPVFVILENDTIRPSLSGVVIDSLSMKKIPDVQIFIVSPSGASDFTNTDANGFFQTNLMDCAVKIVFKGNDIYAERTWAVKTDGFDFETPMQFMSVFKLHRK